MSQHLTHENMKFVPKQWGYELWIVNNDKYCGKILFIKQGKQCSFHYHKVKDEVLYVQTGRIRFRWQEPTTDGVTNGGVQELGPGEAWHVEPGLIHQMTAIEDTTIIEISTHHEDSDSYRLEQPDYWKQFAFPTKQTAEQMLEEAKELRKKVQEAKNNSWGNWKENDTWPELRNPYEPKDAVQQSVVAPVTVSER